MDQNCPKGEFPVENRKIAILRESMVVTYYIKLFHTGADRHNGILMSLLLLVTETINSSKFPTSFKSANISPVFKNGIRLQKDSFRPVSCLIFQKPSRRSEVSNRLNISKIFFQIFSAASGKASSLDIAYY